MSLNRKDLSTAKRGVELQHRHFCFIAAVLAETRPMTDWDEPLRIQWQLIVNAFVAECRRSNSRFNADRFIAACSHDR